MDNQPQNQDEKGQSQVAEKKVRVGWFSFSCCEDSTVIFTEILNDHWQEWKKIIDFRHARVLKTNNVLDELDVAFVEGALAAQEHVDKLKEIREKSKLVVAIGACACTGLPSAQRNKFNELQMEAIKPLLGKFNHLDKVLKLSEVVKVDAEVPGCPMDPQKFLEVLNFALKELGFSS
jgi:coenzyme F420-reducing hydrogenase gamma subunit